LPNFITAEVGFTWLFMWSEPSHFKRSWHNVKKFCQYYPRIVSSWYFFLFLISKSNFEFFWEKFMRKFLVIGKIKEYFINSSVLHLFNTCYWSFLRYRSDFLLSFRVILAKSDQLKQTSVWKNGRHEVQWASEATKAIFLHQQGVS
jgi:hypothetical protein